MGVLMARYPNSGLQIILGFSLLIQFQQIKKASHQDKIEMGFLFGDYLL
jgi:hypothetical protein